MTFHYKDGWYFERIKDGDVRIYHLDAKGLMDKGFVVDASSWVSIVASVSSLGDIAEVYQKATALHQGNIS